MAHFMVVADTLSARENESYKLQNNLRQKGLYLI